MSKIYTRVDLTYYDYSMKVFCRERFGASGFSNKMPWYYKHGHWHFKVPAHATMFALKFIETTGE